MLEKQLIKTITFGMLAAITDDKDRNRYRLEYDLVRNNSPGDCGKVLDDILLIAQTFLVLCLSISGNVGIFQTPVFPG